MSQRLDYFQHAADPARKFSQFSHALHEDPFLAEVAHLVDLRASQLNGCAFCVDMHVKEAKIRGERELRLHHVAVWRESPLFSERERAVLEWTELLTRLPADGVPDEAYARVSAALTEKELAALTFLIVGINGWNRLNVAFRVPPGAMDAQFGLEKAGLK